MLDWVWTGVAWAVGVGGVVLVLWALVWDRARGIALGLLGRGKPLVERLRELAENDPNPVVTESAARAAEEIERWVRWEKRQRKKR